jgi:hypothetical protein
MVGAISSPPSSLTIWAPACSSRTALSNAACGLAWYEPNGMSATMNARCEPRVTALVW